MTHLADTQQKTVARLLALALERGAVHYGEQTRASGRRSPYRYDGRLLSLDPEGANLLARALLPLLTHARVAAVGGPAPGANPIVAATAMASWQQGAPLPAFIVRREPKAHGAAQLIEGPLPSGARVAVVDDVCATGASLLHAVAAAEVAGCSVGLVLAVLDRKEVGSDAIHQRDYPFAALLAAAADGRIRTATQP